MFLCPPYWRGGGGGDILFFGTDPIGISVSVKLLVRFETWIPFGIFWCRNVEQDKATCHVQEWQLWLSYFWSYFPLFCLKYILCPLCNSNTLWNSLMVFDRNVEQDETTCRIQEWQLPFLLFPCGGLGGEVTFVGFFFLKNLFFFSFFFYGKCFDIFFISPWKCMVLIRSARVKLTTFHRSLSSHWPNAPVELIGRQSIIRPSIVCLASVSTFDQSLQADLNHFLSVASVWWGIDYSFSWKSNENLCCCGNHRIHTCWGNVRNFFFKVRELSENSVLCRGKIKFCKNVRENQGILHFSLMYFFFVLNS